MNAQVLEWVVENPAWARATPELSVLTPFLRDDPRPLLDALAAEAGRLDGRAELVLLDDGSGDDVLAEAIAEAVQALRLPARFVRLAANEGRSRGRNRLARHARGRQLLFLDSDMLPDSDHFLAGYLDLIEADDPAVAFGGFTVDQAPHRREHALHRRLALRSDCLPAAQRALQPEKYVFTSNLLIRRDVFEAEPFDEAFTGWGWEDVEWGVRIARRHRITHLDNTATHLGLDEAGALARKYEQSAGNFGRILKAHPDVVRGYPAYRAARLLRGLPLRGLWRRAFKALALSELAPLAVRAFSMRLFRASVWAEAV